MFTHRIDDEVELRLLVPAHAEVVFALTDVNRAHLRRWLPWVDKTLTVADTRAFIESALQSFAKVQAVTCGIWVSGDFAGVIGHNAVNHENRRATLGYWLGEAFCGRGVMTRACRALVDHTIVSMGLNRVEIFAGVGNQKSAAIPRRLGFVEEGVCRQLEWLNGTPHDLRLFAMLRQDWSPTVRTSSLDN